MSPRLEDALDAWVSSSPLRYVARSEIMFGQLLTAGVVDRLLGRRLTTVVGSGMVPRKDHVVVVGLGEVGLCLCLLLREFGVPVIAVEKDPDRYNVARAKNHRLPVVIGRGGSHFLKVVSQS